MCFAVIVGKRASADGSILFGHNEQNTGPNLIHYRHVPHRYHKPSTVVKLNGGGLLPQVAETYAYLWVESPGLEFSDNCFNEWGVAIAGNGCPTKEDSIEEVAARGDIVEGGVGYLLPRLIAERSQTARQGVEVAIALIEQFGYCGSGRSLTIADTDEAWVLAIACGRNYIAQRVPDDAVVLIPNTHIIGSEARLDDTSNVMAPARIAGYAQERGWFDSSKGAQFSFAATFGAPQASGMEREWGICSRQWQAQALVSGIRASLPEDTPLPFAVLPQAPLTVADVAKILRSHQEGTEYDLAHKSVSGSPHEPEEEIDASFARSVCNIATQESVIWQLRDHLPRELGCIAWRATGVPCVSVYTPWYLAVDQVPAAYHDSASLDKALDLAHHFKPEEATFTPSLDSVYWTFQQLAQLAERNYAHNAPFIKHIWREWEQEQFAWQLDLEKMATDLMQRDRDLACHYLASYSVGRALAAWQRARELIEILQSGEETGS